MPPHDAPAVSGYTSLLIPVPEAEPVVASARREGDWSSAYGIPAHLTIAGPWPASVELPAGPLGRIAAGIRGERYALSRLGTLGDAVCLFPATDAGLLRWRARILDAVGVPDLLDESWCIHLTVARSVTRELPCDLAASIARALPIACVAETLLLAKVREGVVTTARL